MKTISNHKAKQLSKPWITKGIRISITLKNKLYASGDTAHYKIYRNKPFSVIILIFGTDLTLLTLRLLST